MSNLVIKKSMPINLGCIIMPILLGMVFLTGCGGGGGRSNSNPSGTPGTISISGENPINIPETAYGQNYWDWVPSWANGVVGSETRMADLRVNIYRGGGQTIEIEDAPEPWDYSQIDRYIAFCRTIHAEPLLQVQIIKGNPAKAAATVQYCNIQKGYNVKYWCIGNEPDLYDGLGRPGYNVQDYIRDFRAFASAMKAVDPTIRLVGPELSFAYTGGNDWLSPFLQACGDLVDIVSFHHYPYGQPGEFTIENVLGKPNTVRERVQTVKATVRRYCGSSKPIALDETHVSYDGNVYGEASAETFYAGLWIADSIGIALEERLWTVALWCTSGGYGTGFLDSGSPDRTPLPSYYAMQMFTNHFGPRLIRATAETGIAAYASRNAADNRTIVIVINKTSTQKQEMLHFTGFSQSIADRQFTFPAYSLTCLSIPDDGSAMECWLYTKTIADQKEPPSYQSIP